MGPPSEPRKIAQWLQLGEGHASLLEGAPSIPHDSDPVPGKRLGNGLPPPGQERGHAGGRVCGCPAPAPVACPHHLRGGKTLGDTCGAHGAGQSPPKD